MLRNIIFDMGNVLIEFNPARFVCCVGLDDAADRELLLKEIFRSEDWRQGDSGEIDEAEMEKRVFGRIPERLHAAAHRLIFRWNELAAPIDGMKRLVADCKAAGLGIYLLSNASVRQPEYWPDIPGSEYFDGAVVSACCRCVKPSKEIFRLTMEKFGLRAEECLFVDDVQENVDGAEKAGLMGFLFTGDADALRRAVREMGAKV